MLSINRLPKGKKSFYREVKRDAIRYLMSAIDLFTNSQVDVEGENSDFDMTDLAAAEIESENGDKSSTDEEVINHVLTD